jgi:hypothetical protein
MKAWCGLVLLALAVAAGCGDDNGTGDGGLIHAPHQSCDYPNVDAHCGNPCTSQADCGDSLFCSADEKCTAECVVGGAGSCGTGQVCGLFGRCVPSGSGGGGGGGNGDGGACPRIDVNLSPVTPNVYLLLDQSSSMTSKDFPITQNGTTQNVSRWDALKFALTDPTTGVLPQLDTKVRFAAALYTGVKKTSTKPAVCPQLTETPPLANDAAAVDMLLKNNPLGDTPTGESLTVLVSQLQSTQVFEGQQGDPTVIVLATDGDPDTCANPDSNGTQPPRDLAVNAAKSAFAAGFPIFMLSLSSDPTQQHMQDMANAGAGLPVGGGSNAPFYSAKSTQELVDAFNTIIGGVRTCKIRLNGTLDESGAATGDVRLNGAALQYNDPNGWKLIDSMTIELEGEACTIFENSQTGSLTATFACGSVIL